LSLHCKGFLLSVVLDTLGCGLDVLDTTLFILTTIHPNGVMLTPFTPKEKAYACRC